tara:strand:- start:589 stop:1260 length:672 start_codon:yes stop_codon:yes gene_type:complete
MNWETEHEVWVQQVNKLIASNRELRETGSGNILCHFFAQVIERDFCHASESTRQRVKEIARTAVEMAPRLTGTHRARAAAVLSQCLPLDESTLGNMMLNDLRNIVVFEVFKRCGVTVDTYFERYSSPPGSAAQSAAYLSIAHGKAKCTAAWVDKLSFVVNAMQLLHTVFVVYDLFKGTPVKVDAATLNWHGVKWRVHILKRGLGDLVWNVFLDVWEYEHSVYK